MAYSLSFQDQSSLGDVVHGDVIQFPLSRISVRELIEKRVETEVKRLLAASEDIKSMLVQPSSDESVLNGEKSSKRRHIDIVQQQKVAIDAFRTNGFFLLVNDKQLTELDDVIHITPKSKVVFFKLVPVVGG